ncbi:Flp pilus assembly CpaF family ATPase [Micromonospora sp. Llam0]|uniref:CpaF family protein n=1 Tax=Micromonospora sp. Llam0 TaxID=2485143 RepID=UPI000F46BD3F|nr:ATPase, T2SS/T4P/T4SS family [Micromonospora sp. Llam0]ROO52722.1 Flp pilus assembly CpaF family ATPase [Micromonospora sp. Llam0]
MTSAFPVGHTDRDALRAEVSRRLQQDAIDEGGDAGRDAVLDGLIAEVLREHNLVALAERRPPLSTQSEQSLRQSLRDSFLGLGDLQPYIDDPDVENIDVNGADTVFVSYAGKRPVQVGPIASSDDELIDMLQTLARHSGAQERRFDPGMPRLDLRLPGGARLFATMAVTQRVCVSIRRHRFPQLGLSDLADMGTISPGMVGLFGALVAARCNIVISGGMDTGKTTMARALCRAIEPWERIITIEDPYELGLDLDPAHPNVVAMQPREPNIEGQGGVDMTALVRWATRMRPDHVVVGEVRGGEVIPLLNAFNQGTDGSLTTIHASSTREAFMKIASYARQTREQLPFDVTFQLIGGGVDIVVQLGKNTDGQRFVTGIREVVDADATQVRSNEIYRPGPHRHAMLTGRFSDTMVDRLIEVGYDPQSLGARGSA